MEHVIYYRKSLMDKNELEAASKHFKCVSLLSDIKENQFIIPRYSMYPFPIDQEKEIQSLGSKVINTYQQHKYAADLQNYLIDLKELTPKTWDNILDIPDSGPFILKGETNSKKSNWNKFMFAKDKKEAIEIYGRLCEDSLIGDQKIFIREYVPLVTYMEGIGGIPISEEFRFFAAYGEIIAGGYYWQNYIDELSVKPDVDQVPKDFLKEVLLRINNKINFVVFDVAKTVSGKWIVIELNDACASGTSCIDLNELYSNLKIVLDKQNII